ncbi:hypothetical protein CKM354_000507000 [Cercospora kikuchii]|uniref:RING-type domain-containing protein n=1 Tax=Cercospora kikuchii TaxID=84275 RepID=A0A9P3FGS2_9PEZI|nr:uncharacterized protein CKM354_000507000 [Cercospora kikuchii]GIZ41775.1 hypothetical protein CKM354_000507000 [Cercospora kikuchii]
MGCCIVCYSADPPHRAAYEAAFFTCRHKEFACPKCWESYILQCLKTPSKPIECIQPGCNHLLTEQDISKRVSPETYFKLVSRVRLGDGLLELTRGRLTKVSQLNTAVFGPAPSKVCPSMGCAEVVKKESDSEHTICPECGHDFCWLCLAAIEPFDSAIAGFCMHKLFCPLRKGGSIADESDEALFAHEAEAAVGDEMSEGWAIV